MQFEKDIFISYAHIDDEPLSEGLNGWISDFHKSLEVRLAQLLGKRPVIWRCSYREMIFSLPKLLPSFQS
jgi:hypothetical protein